MGQTSSIPVPIPPRGPIKNGKLRICVAAYDYSHRASASHALAAKIGEHCPKEYETYYYFVPYAQYHQYLLDTFDPIPFPDHLKGHSTSPFIWIESGEDQKMELLGGLDRFKTWAQSKNLPNPPKDLLEVMDSKEPAYTWFFTYHSTLAPATWEH